MNKSKQIIVLVVGVAAIIGLSLYYSINLSKTPQLVFTTVKKTTIAQAVKVDGTVTSAQDLSLSFQQGGVIADVLVKAGDNVKQGQALVKLNNADASAAVNQASAQLASAKANYNKVVNGATGADVDVAQAAVATAQTNLTNAQKNLQALTSQQNLLVKNALSVLINSNLAATPSSNNVSQVSPTITGNYTGTLQGQYFIKIYSAGTGWRFSATGLETADGMVSSAPVALGTQGLYIQFPSSNLVSGDTWTVTLPNTQGASYLTNYNAYQAALQTQNQTLTAAQSAVDSAQSALAQAKANLELKQTAARPEDIAAAQAQIQAASASLQSAQSAFSKTLLTAPIDGVVASIDAKIGQNVTGSTIAPSAPVVKLLSSEKFQIDTYVSEADVAKIKVGDSANVSLDAYGSSLNFPAQVITIDPGATVHSGVSAYKTTLQFTNSDDRIKEGMGASVVINDADHQNALVIPKTAIIQKGNDDYVLLQISGNKTQTTKITTGITSIDGSVEVISGLNENDNVATFGNQ